MKNNFSQYITSLFEHFQIKYEISHKTSYPTFDFECRRSGDTFYFNLNQRDIEMYDDHQILQGSLLEMDNHIRVYIRDNKLNKIIE